MLRSTNLIPSMTVITTLLIPSFSPGHAAAKGTMLILAANGEAAAKDKPLLSRSSLWESAPAFHVFKMHGYDVEFATPKGGKIIFGMDEDEVDPTPMVTYAIRYEGFRDRADHSLAMDQVDPKAYQGVFIGGGAGAVMDLAKDPATQKVLAQIYENNGVLGACGHGVAAFPFVKLKSGEYLVKGRKMTGYPNTSEANSKWTQGGKLLPFLVEDALRKNGAIFQTKADHKNKFDVVVDQRIVTAMFLGSCAVVTKEMVEILKK